MTCLADVSQSHQGREYNVEYIWVYIDAICIMYEDADMYVITTYLLWRAFLIWWEVTVVLLCRCSIGVSRSTQMPIGCQGKRSTVWYRTRASIYLSPHLSISPSLRPSVCLSVCMSTRCVMIQPGKTVINRITSLQVLSWLREDFFAVSWQ